MYDQRVKQVRDYERQLMTNQSNQLKNGSWTEMLPESVWGSAAVSLVFTVTTGFGLAVLGVRWFENYGWGLFVVQPFAMGFVAALIYGARRPRSLGGCMRVACLSILMLGVAFLALAFEGMLCLIMAAPLGLLLALMGAMCAYVVQRRFRSHSAPAFLCVVFILVPGIDWIECIATPAPAVFEVKSSLDIHAAPEKVWQQVIAFTEIPPPTEWMFRAGVAYPIRAEIVGRGPGAERHCVFSTGAFVEPIEVWEEPHRLKFSVTSNPEPMQEWTPYAHIDPPHLHGFLISKEGQFLLIPLPDGGTRLEGTTWYQHGLWPAAYWRFWSDVMIHRIHMRVLRHIRDEAEQR